MKAVPVWHPNLPGVAYLSRRFQLPATYPGTDAGHEAWLYCAGSGVYEVCVNGQSAGRGFGPAFTDLPVWNQCDISDHLHPGDNTIVARASAGPPSGSGPWFMADGGVRTSPRTTLELTTGDLWDVRAAGRDSEATPESSSASEFYLSGSLPWHSWVPTDGGLEKPSPVEGGGSEPVLWSPPAIVENERLAVKVVAFGEVDANQSLETVEPVPFTKCKCLNREALLSPGRRDSVMRAGPPDRAVCVILDFGRPIAGFPLLRLKPGAAVTIEIGFALVLGSIDSVLHYVAGGGKESWSGLQLRYSRYLIMRIGGVAEDVAVDCVSMIERQTTTGQTGEFSNPDRLAAVWRIGQRTLATRAEVYRRQSGIWNWLLVHALTLGDYYVDGGGGRASAILQSSKPPGITADDPAPLLAYLLFLDAHLWYHGGDNRQSADAASLALGLADTCVPQCRSDGLLHNGTGELCFSALNALYAGALAAVIRLCRSSGNDHGAARIRERWGQVKQGLQGLWDAGRGLFIDGEETEDGFSQWTNGLMLYFDLVESAQQLERMLRGLRGTDVARPEDLLQAFFLVGGLWRSREQELALTHVDQHWGRVATREGGSWCEKWDRGTGNEVPGPEYYLGSEVLGVRPVSSGYETVEVAPQFAGIDRAEGAVPTCCGMVRVAWRVGETFRLRVERSQMGRTHLRIPRRDRRFPTVTVNGEPVWRNEKFHPNSVVREVVCEEDEVMLVTEGSGPYDIQAG